MIAPLRRTHQIAWSLLAVALPGLLMSAIVAAPDVAVPAAGTAREDDAPSSEALEGCWGNVQVRLVTASDEQMASPGSLQSAVPPGRRVGTASAEDSKSGEASTTVSIVTPEGSVAPASETNAAFAGIQILDSPDSPSLYAYWLPGITGAGSGLASGARFIGRVSAGDTLDIADEPAAAERTLALYSLARDETVGVIHLLRQTISLKGCQ